MVAFPASASALASPLSSPSCNVPCVPPSCAGCAGANALPLPLESILVLVCFCSAMAPVPEGALAFLCHFPPMLTRPASGTARRAGVGCWDCMRSWCWFPCCCCCWFWGDPAACAAAFRGIGLAESVVLNMRDDGPPPPPPARVSPAGRAALVVLNMLLPLPPPERPREDALAPPSRREWVPVLPARASAPPADAVVFLGMAPVLPARTSAVAATPFAEAFARAGTFLGMTPAATSLFWSTGRDELAVATASLGAAAPDPSDRPFLGMGADPSPEGLALALADPSSPSPSADLFLGIRAEALAASIALEPATADEAVPALGWDLAEATTVGGRFRWTVVVAAAVAIPSPAVPTFPATPAPPPLDPLLDLFAAATAPRVSATLLEKFIVRWCIPL